MNDGPQGFRAPGHDGTSTQWPSSLTMAATWDRDMIREWGVAMGREFKGKGANVYLGPGVCVQRVPKGGRTFEYLSGEDPYLGAQLVAPLLDGVQGQGLIATTKHYILNSQESNRMGISENADERTRMEIYAPPFAAAVRAGTLGVMCSYNLLNGTAACGDSMTLSRDLKSAWGYEGFVVSDWWATHSTVGSANAGLDMEMPIGLYYGNLSGSVSKGEVSQKMFDDKALRILTSMFAAGLMDAPLPSGTPATNVTSAAANAQVRKFAAAATVLLKNNGLLPLNVSDATASIAVIGAAGNKSLTTGGGGSGSVVPYYQVSVLEGIAARVANPSRLNCTYEKGWDYFQLLNPSVVANSAEDCCAQCSQAASCTAFTYEPDNGVSGRGRCWLKPNANGRTKKPTVTSGHCWPSGRPVVYDDGSNIDSAVATAQAADVAIVVVAATSSEGFDRATLGFPGNEDELASAVAKAQPRTIVVAIGPGSILTPWSDDAAAVLSVFMPGQEEGNSVADVIFGDVNPSGKLPLTFPNVDNEQNFTQVQFPGTPAGLFPKNANYTEGLYVGYRWYNTHGVTPKFPFGHGLSYTQFTYSDLVVSGRNVSCTLTNAGPVEGAEVAQLYVTFPTSAGEPPSQLRGFFKSVLQPGAATTVTFDALGDSDLAIWDVTTRSWQLQTGTFGIEVGSSSRDIRLKGEMTV